MMVPIYAIYSLLTLFLFEWAPYFAMFRDMYEAYALYMFFALCVEYAGGTDSLVSSVMQQPPTKLLFPLWCFTVQPGQKLVRVCRQGILQYALIRPIVSVVSAFLLFFGYYDEGDWQADKGYLYATIINNICVSTSLYCLAQFYQVAKEELKPYRPLLKFAVIKMIVFFCYWQSVVIAILVAFQWIPPVEGWSSSQVAVSSQALLICFEMAIFAVLHIWAFPYAVYKVSAMSQTPLVHQIELRGGVMKGVAHAANQRDMVSDTIESFVPGYSKQSVADARKAPGAPKGKSILNEDSVAEGAKQHEKDMEKQTAAAETDNEEEEDMYPADLPDLGGTARW